MLRIALSLVCCPRSVISMHLLFSIQTLSTSLFLSLYLTSLIPHPFLLLLLLTLVLLIILLILLSSKPYHSAPILFYQSHFNSLIACKAKLPPRLYMKFPSISSLVGQYYVIDILCHSIRLHLLGGARIQLAYLLQPGY